MNFVDIGNPWKYKPSFGWNLSNINPIAIN
jgi:hypothetical protein